MIMISKYASITISFNFKKQNQEISIHSKIIIMKFALNIPLYWILEAKLRKVIEVSFTYRLLFTWMKIKYFYLYFY